MKKKENSAIMITNHDVARAGRLADTMAALKKQDSDLITLFSAE